MTHRPNVACAAGLLVALTVILVAGCGSGRLVIPVRVTSTALAEPTDARALTTYDRAVCAVAAIFAHDLSLPLPERVTVYVYGSRQFFERGLVNDGQVSPARAAELSDFAIGVGRRAQLLLNDEGADHRSAEWLRLIAHEMTHVAQIELARGEGRAAQWLAEGMAEWVAFTVLERMKLDTVAHRRAVARIGIRNYAALAAARLDLDTLASPRGFTVRHRRDGSLPTYQLAFLMADYLIERAGLDRVIAYFRSFAESQDRHANFERIFGQSSDEFEREVLAYLKSVVP